MDLAKELEHPLEKLPDAKFYANYYKKINSSKSLLGEKWKAGKKDQTQWLREQIEKHGGNQAKVLSVGAGIGIIEIPLIESGYDIHLQEYQEESLKIFGAHNLTTCYNEDLKEIRNKK